MIVELQHHYGWTEYDIEANSLEEAAYKAVLQSHDFLTKDNHIYEVGQHSFEWGGALVEYDSVCIYRNENSPKKIIADHFGDWWFSVEYRKKV